jgi:hypothetical protein
LHSSSLESARLLGTTLRAYDDADGARVTGLLELPLSLSLSESVAQPTKLSGGALVFFFVCCYCSLLHMVVCATAASMLQLSLLPPKPPPLRYKNKQAKEELTGVLSENKDAAVLCRG